MLCVMFHVIVSSLLFSSFLVSPLPTNRWRWEEDDRSSGQLGSVELVDIVEEEKKKRRSSTTRTTEETVIQSDSPLFASISTLIINHSTSASIDLRITTEGIDRL